LAVPGEQAPREKHPARAPRAQAELRILLAEARRAEDRAAFQARREAIELEREEVALELDRIDVGRRRLAAHRDALGLGRDAALTALCLVAVGIVLAALIMEPDPYLALGVLGVLAGGLGVNLWLGRSGSGAG
jgi:hypothetical protein